MGVLFVAGVYGVGKSTLCEQLSVALEKPFYSAGDLISRVTGEVYGANKVVKDKLNNQEILVEEIRKELNSNDQIILAGHFCIYNKDNEVDPLPDDVFQKLNINKILLLEAETKRMLLNLSKRDGRQYEHQQMYDLQEAERAMAEKVSRELGCDLLVHSMLFDGSDFNKCLELIGKGGW